MQMQTFLTMPWNSSFSQDRHEVVGTARCVTVPELQHALARRKNKKASRFYGIVCVA
jgi:hypothetical protein